jgi:hypothetical protein
MPELCVRDYELGVEWEPIKAFELVATWVIADRTLKIARYSITDKEEIY